MPDTYRSAASILVLRNAKRGGVKHELLLVHKPRKKDAWQLPQGGMEEGETPEQGAATSVWAALAPELESVGGLYLENCNQALPWSEANPFEGVMQHRAVWKFPDADTQVFEMYGSHGKGKEMKMMEITYTRKS